MFMLFSVHNKIEKREFNSLTSVAGILEYISSKGIEFKRGNIFHDQVFKE